MVNITDPKIQARADAAFNAFEKDHPMLTTLELADPNLFELVHTMFSIAYVEGCKDQLAEMIGGQQNAG